MLLVNTTPSLFCGYCCGDVKEDYLVAIFSYHVVIFKNKMGRI
jgi:hypothetical protein